MRQEVSKRFGWNLDPGAEATMYFDALLKKIQERRGSPVGASASDIDELEAALGVRLPAAYREFLAAFGRDYHGLWRGSGLFIDDVLENQSVCRLLLSDHEIDPATVDGAVVWLTHQGYVASWFFPDSGPDPTAFLFAEGAREPGVHSRGTFTQLVHADGEGLLSLTDRHRHL